MTLIVIYFFPPVSCDWKLTWFVLLAKSQRAVLSKPFTCFSLLEKCKQRAPVSASVWHHLPAVFLKSLFLQVCSYKKEERENLLFLPFFLLFSWLWNPVFLRGTSDEAAVPVTVRSCRTWRAPPSLWLSGWGVRCLLHQVPWPASSYCWFPFLTDAGPQGWPPVLSCSSASSVLLKTAIFLLKLRSPCLAFICACCWFCWREGKSLIKGEGRCGRSRNLLDIQASTACAQLEVHWVTWLCRDVAGSLSSHVPRRVTPQELSRCRAGSDGRWCSVHLGVHSCRCRCLERLERSVGLAWLSKFCLTTRYHLRKGEI